MKIKDCVDDYSPEKVYELLRIKISNIFVNFYFKTFKFSYNACDGNGTLKCDDGRCYNITSYPNIDCSFNLTAL